MPEQAPWKLNTNRAGPLPTVGEEPGKYLQAASSAARLRVRDRIGCTFHIRALLNLIEQVP